VQFIKDKIKVDLEKISYEVNLYDTPLVDRWLRALEDNLQSQRILEKNFCFLGFAGSKRDLSYLCTELNKVVEQINSFNFTPPYEKIHPFVSDDFQYSDRLPTGLCPDGDEMSMPGLRLKHDACNLLHRYFEELQGTAWQISDYYRQADHETKYAIRQLNNICHEIENYVLSYRKSIVDPDWIRPAQITTFLNAPRHDLDESDLELFKQNRYDRELGGVYLHWSQVGKTLYEVFRDENAPKMTEAMCSEINHQRYYSGEFDVEWGQSITESTHEFKQVEMHEYRSWLADNGYEWEDAKLSLGYIKLGQVDIKKTFGHAPYKEIYKVLSDNLNIKKISTANTSADFPYTLESDDWKKIQIESLSKGYESRNMR
jgi:hypothetical protein